MNQHPIDQLWVVLNEDPDGNEAIVAAGVPGTTGFPMVTASPMVAQQFLKTARRHVKAAYPNGRVKLVRFSTKELIQYV